MPARKQKKTTISLDNFLSIVTIVLAIVAIYSIQEVRIYRTTSDLNFCPGVTSVGTCGFSSGAYCSNDLFEGYCETEGDLIIAAEVFNKGLALATDILLKVRFEGAVLNITRKDSCTSNVMDYYVDGVFKQQSVVCEQSYGIIASEGIHILKPQDSAKISFVYPDEVFLEKPSKIIFELYEGGKPIKEKTFDMQYIEN